jgi:hypothetical protein
MRKKGHSIGDIVYVKGQRGMIRGVKEDGSGIVHDAKTGLLLGTVPSFNEMKRLPINITLDEIKDSESDYVVAKDDYMDRDFSSPVPAAVNSMERKQSASRLSVYRKDYFDAIKTGNSEDEKVALDALSYEAVVTGADKELVLQGKCGIDGCEYDASGGMEPPHLGSTNCGGGGKPHCTCDSCF